MIAEKHGHSGMRYILNRKIWFDVALHALILLLLLVLLALDVDIAVAATADGFLGSLPLLLLHPLQFLNVQAHRFVDDADGVDGMLDSCVLAAAHRVFV